MYFVGIPMGTNCAPLVADLLLFCYERDFLRVIIQYNRITSSVNGWQFPIINNNDMDWTSCDLIYVITWAEINCGM